MLARINLPKLLTGAEGGIESGEIRNLTSGQPFDTVCGNYNIKVFNVR
jgi:hypothetical protein